MQQELTRAARKAINELNLPCEVVSVVDTTGRNGWSIQFTTGYGELTDTFHNEVGERYSHQQIVEIIKQHLSVRDELRVQHSDR